MKIDCIECEEQIDAAWIAPCECCGEHVCSECYPKHEKYCKDYDHDIIYNESKHIN